MRVTPRFLTASLIVVGFLLVAGCRQDTKEDTGLPTDTAPSMDASGLPQQAVIVDPELLVLQNEDMPSGFRGSTKRREDNRKLARRLPDPDFWYDRYQQWGRIEGLTATFATGPFKEEIQSGADVYQTIDGARDAFREERRQFENVTKELLRGQGMSVERVEVTDGPAIGHDSYLVYVRASATILGTPVAVDMVGVGFRVANINAGVFWTSFESYVLRADVIALAERQSGAIRDDLNYALQVREQRRTDLEQALDRFVRNRPELPEYLLDPVSFERKVSTVWATFTSWITRTDLTGDYHDLYYMGVHLDSMSWSAAIQARRALREGKVDRAAELYGDALQWQLRSGEAFSAAAQVFDGNLEAGERLAQGIRGGSRWAVRGGFTLLAVAGIGDPVTAGKVSTAVDYVFMAADYAVERALLGEEKADLNLATRVIVKQLVEQVPFAELGGSTLAAYARGITADRLVAVLQQVLESETAEGAVERAFQELAVEGVKGATEAARQEVVEYMLEAIRGAEHRRDLKPSPVAPAPREEPTVASADASTPASGREPTELWTRQFGTRGNDRASTVAVDDAGRVYVAGRTKGAFLGQVSGGADDAYLRAYDGAGEELWTRQFGTREYDDVQGVAVGSAGRVYVAGGAGALPGQASAGGRDAYLRAYDAAGEELWTRQFGTGTRYWAVGVAVGGAGRV